MEGGGGGSAKAWGLKVGERGGAWGFEWQVRAANYGCGNAFRLLDSITERNVIHGVDFSSGGRVFCKLKEMLKHFYKNGTRRT